MSTGGSSLGTAIVIAVGGSGDRLGGGKPDRSLGDASLLQHALSLANQWGGPLAVSVRDEVPSSAGSAAVTKDSALIEGPIAALESGFRFAAEHGCSYLLLLACDMPFLPPDLLPRLQRAIGEAKAALPVSEGRPQTMAGLWKVDPEPLEVYLATGQRSLWRFAEQQNAVRIYWEDPASHDPFADIDDQAALDEAERRLVKE